MQNQTVDPLLIDDLIYYFCEKKRLTKKNYQYYSAGKNAEYMEEAALLCKKHNLNPAAYVQIIYDNLGTLKNMFNTSHLAGPAAKKILKDREETEDTYTVEITNANLDYSLVWQQQHQLVMTYVKNGEKPESILLDSGLKLYAWFRILSTPDILPEVIDKYKHIAKQELNPSLTRFIKENNLAIDRIFS